jgi:hypothetical protein
MDCDVALDEVEHSALFVGQHICSHNVLIIGEDWNEIQARSGGRRDGRDGLITVPMMPERGVGSHRCGAIAKGARCVKGCSSGASRC